jgi:hypothetical protein
VQGGNSGEGTGPGVNESEDIKFCTSLYSIIAPRITLLSNPNILDNEASSIMLNAIGNEDTEGSVSIDGSDSVHVNAGPEAYIHLATEEEVIGTITIDCGAEGTVVLQSGLTQEPNHITMNPEGITVRSLEQIFQEVEDNTLTMTPEGITLQAGDSIIEMTPEGITLTCGDCVVEITAEGVTVNGLTITLAGDTEVSVSGASVSLEGETDVSITAPAVTIA